MVTHRGTLGCFCRSTYNLIIPLLLLKIYTLKCFVGINGLHPSSKTRSSLLNCKSDTPFEMVNIKASDITGEMWFYAPHSSTIYRIVFTAPSAAWLLLKTHLSADKLKALTFCFVPFFTQISLHSQTCQQQVSENVIFVSGFNPQPASRAVYRGMHTAIC